MTTTVCLAHGRGVISALSFGRKLVDLPCYSSRTRSPWCHPYFAQSTSAARAGSPLCCASCCADRPGFGWITASCALARDLAPGSAARRFDERSVALTAPLMACYGLGLVPLAAESIVVQHYFARRNVLRPVIIGIGAVALHVLLLSVSWRWLGPPAIALSLVVAKSVKVLILIRARTPSLRRPPAASSWVDS